MKINVIPGFDIEQVVIPFPSPFILSSVERDWCNNDSAKIVYIKRRHLEENLKAIQQDVPMDEVERNRFIGYWSQPLPDDPSAILAEKCAAFDIRYRAKIWLEKARRPTIQQPKSRLEKYAESARQFFQNAQAVSAGPKDASGVGYADIPDEQ